MEDQLNFKSLTDEIIALDTSIQHVKIIDDQKFKTISEKMRNKIDLKEALSRSSNDCICVLRYVSDKDKSSISSILDTEKGKENQLIYYTDDFIIYVTIKKNIEKIKLMKIADHVESLIKKK